MTDAFNRAWNLLKAISTEDLQHAARAGGLRMTPERMADYRQAYEEQGMTPTGAQIHSAPSLSYLGGTGNQSDANRLIAAQKINERRGKQPLQDYGLRQIFPSLPFDPLHSTHYSDESLGYENDETPMSEVNQERSWSPMGGMDWRMVEDVPTYDPEGPARIDQPRFPQTNPARPEPEPPAPRRDVFKPIQTTPKVQVRPRRGGGPNSQRNRMMQRSGNPYHSRR